MRALKLIAVIAIIVVAFILIREDYQLTSFFIQDDVVAVIHIEPEYLNVQPSEEIISEVTIYRAVTQEVEDVRVVTSVVSDEGVIVYNSEQTLALQTSLSFVSRVSIPEGIDDGSYKLVISIFNNENGNLEGKASQRFFVDSVLNLSPLEKNNWLILVIALLFLIIVGLFLAILLKHDK